MAISQTTITGSIKTPAGDDAMVTAVTFTLSGSDFEAGEIVAVNTVEAVVDTENGDFEVTLWPNDKGLDGDTRYAMAFKFSDGSSVPGLRDIRVRHSDAPRVIEDIVAETRLSDAVAPSRLIILTRTQYDGLETLLPDTFYLIKGA